MIFTNTRINISIDDVEYLFYELISRGDSLTSIYDTSLLRYLKRLHDLYDAKFTLFCYNEAFGLDISDLPIKFKTEFVNASDWLKFGFHWYSSDYDPLIPIKSLNSNIRSFYEKVVKKIGTQSISHFIRLHYFHSYQSGTLDLSPISNICDEVILLSPGNISRKCYDLTDNERIQLHNEGEYYRNGIGYRISDTTCESINIFRLPKIFNNNRETINIYTHEWYLRGSGKKEWISKFMKGNMYPIGCMSRFKLRMIVKRFCHSGFIFTC